MTDLASDGLVRPRTAQGRALPELRGLVRCRLCVNPITVADNRCQVAGAFEHRLANPDGVVFHVGCYRDAPGCALSGQPTTAHTWFPPYRWQYARCDACGNQLGWYFEAGRECFYALILVRLRFDDAS